MHYKPCGFGQNGGLDEEEESESKANREAGKRGFNWGQL